MKRLMAFCLALMLLVCAIPMRQADADTNMTATVKGGWLHLRKSPSTNSTSLGAFYTGTKVTVLDGSGSWYYVRVNGQTGYMLGSYLTFDAGSGSTGAPAGNLNITAWVTSSNGGAVRLRTGPSTGYAVLGSYPVGTKVTIKAKGTYWDQVMVGGKMGYMMNQYLTTTEPSTSGSTGGNTGSTGSTGSTGGYTAYVYAANGGNVNLRSGAGKNFAVIGSYTPGTQLTVLSYGVTWCSVRVGTRTGYMMTEFLRTTSEGTGSTTTPPPSTGSYTAWVTSTNGYGVRMRTGAGTSFRVITTLPVGTQVTVLQHGTTWDYIRHGTTDGYMQNTYLTTIAPGESTDTPAPGGYTATVYAANGLPVRMRKGPGTNYAAITSLAVGTRVTVTSVSNGWAYITYNGTTGYMMSSYLVRDLIALTGVTVNVSTAKPGETLTATVAPAGATATYTWIDGNGNTLGTSSSYTVKAEDVGKKVAVRVIGSGDYTGTVTSSYVTIAEADKTALKSLTITSKGSISMPEPGDVLSVKLDPADATATYEWFRGETKVGTGTQYTVTKDDIGAVLKCVATGSGEYSGKVEASTGKVVKEATPTDLK